MAKRLYRECENKKGVNNMEATEKNAQTVNRMFDYKAQKEIKQSREGN